MIKSQYLQNDLALIKYHFSAILLFIEILDAEGVLVYDTIELFTLNFLSEVANYSPAKNSCKNLVVRKQLRPYGIERNQKCSFGRYWTGSCWRNYDQNESSHEVYSYYILRCGAYVLGIQMCFGRLSTII